MRCHRIVICVAVVSRVFRLHLFEIVKLDVELLMKGFKASEERLYSRTKGRQFWRISAAIALSSRVQMLWRVLFLMLVVFEPHYRRHHAHTEKAAAIPGRVDVKAPLLLVFPDCRKEFSLTQGGRKVPLCILLKLQTRFYRGQGLLLGFVVGEQYKQRRGYFG